MEVPKKTDATSRRDAVRGKYAPPIDPLDCETIGRLGRQHYEAEIRQQLEAEYRGKYVAINVQTGEFEVGETLSEALDRGIEHWPHANRYVHRVGYRGIVRIGPSRSYWQREGEERSAMIIKYPTRPPYSTDEVIKRGERYYEAEIRQQLEADHHGEYVVINTDTGEYDVDTDRRVVSRRARERWPYAGRFLLRVGYPAIGRLGGARWRG
jgi:hypothetical protein